MSASEEPAKGGAGAGNQRRARKREVARSRRLRAVVLGFVGALLLVGFTGVVGMHCFANRPGPAVGDRVAVSWPAGLGASEAADLLADLGLVGSPTAMSLYLRTVGAAACFEPGPHLLPSQATPKLLAELLCRDPDAPRVTVTIPEGFHRFAVAARLESSGVCARDAFVKASADPELLHALGLELGAEPGADTAEGFLFPATYRLALDSDPAEVVRRMVEESDKRWRALVATNAAGLATLAETLGFGRREIVTLASIVEKEAAVADERPIIASVFLNRMRDRRAFPSGRLESDPTAMYACHAIPDAVPSCAGWNGRASPALNRDPANTFSTYTRAGLPPGPIASPGDEAVEAVLAPRDTRYFYFVAAGQNRHTFSETFEQHQQAVRKLRERHGR
ncbi:MAG: endolytic transglycosylase MltG [Polyangiaceae bacterium]|nr:endolytic transglycosylase MltG [Polyangiaceae bacterium]